MRFNGRPLDQSNRIPPLDIPREPRTAAIADVGVPSSKPAMGIKRGSANGQDGPEGTFGRGELEGPGEALAPAHKEQP
jgi:hypothetical protein